MTYHVVHPDYVGPFEGLYQQLYNNRSSLQSFALALVVEGYVAFLCQRREPGIDLDEASNFLIMVSTLLDFKARLLFPPAEPDDDREELPLAEDPEAHLEEYRRFQQVAQWLANVGQERQQLVSREPAEPADLGISGPDPLAQVTLRDLLRAFDRVFMMTEDAQEPLAPVYRDQWTVEEQIQWLEECLAGAGVIAFTAVFNPGSRRVMLIVTFLALLELIKLGIVGARQDSPDDEIKLIWLGRAADLKKDRM